jgi:hypothetical protein
MITQSQLAAASSGTAWKTASMRGYLKKTALDAATYGTGAYKLTFREAANDDGSPVDHDFYFNVDTTVYTSPIPNDTTLVLDFELLRHVLTANWQTSTAEDCEAARVGTGGKW